MAARRHVLGDGLADAFAHARPIVTGFSTQRSCAVSGQWSVVSAFGAQLAAKQLADFRKERARIDDLMRRNPVSTKVATAGAGGRQ